MVILKGSIRKVTALKERREGCKLARRSKEEEEEGKYVLKNLRRETEYFEKKIEDLEQIKKLRSEIILTRSKEKV